MKKLLLLLLLFPLYGNAQSAQRFYTALLPNPQGENYVAVIPNASVYVCQYNIDNQCLFTEPIYADTDLTQPIVQPLLADGSGVYSYYVQSGTQVVEKVCAPFDQCSSYQVQIGDKVAGVGTGTVTDFTAGDLPPVFTTTVTTSTTTPHLAFNLSNAADLSFLGNVSGSTGAPSYVHLIQGANITLTEGSGSLTIAAAAPTPAVEFQVEGVDTLSQTLHNLVAGANVTITNPSGGEVVISASGGGGGNCTGTNPGDNTSTDCGFDNRLSDTAAIPSSDSTFGFTNLNTNTVIHAVAVGTLNGAFNTGKEAVLIGDSNATGLTGGGNACHLNLDNIIGAGNFGGSTLSDGGGTLTGVCAGSNLTENTVIGDYNALYTPTPGSAWVQNVIIGSLNANTDMAGQNLQNPGFFNSVIIGNTSARGISADDAICMGDSACDNHAFTAINTVFGIVAIGQTAGSGLQDGTNTVVDIGLAAGGFSPTYNGLYGAGSEQINIGDSAGSMNTGTDTVALGDSALEGIHVLTPPLLSHNTGNDIIAIGNQAGRAQTTGAFNIYIGDNAGCIGCSSTVVGNGNQTGSHNVNIGSSAGPNTSTQLSNTIAIGWNAATSASNETVIGNASTTLAVVFGNLEVNAGTNVVFRCATAGALPAGALTITAGSCGTTTDTGLRVQ